MNTIDEVRAALLQASLTKRPPSGITEIIAAGLSFKGTNVVAWHSIDSVLFAMYLGGKPYLVTSPHYSLQEAVDIVRARLTRLSDCCGCRESNRDKLFRKAIAAQGETFLLEMRTVVPMDLEQELGRMFASASRSTVSDIWTVQTGKHGWIKIHRNGIVEGFPDIPLKGSNTLP